MTVLVAGAGDLGTEAGLRFASLGHRVVAWRRAAHLVPPPLEGVHADLSGALPTIPADVLTIVVSVAADASTEADYRTAYVDGLQNLLGAVLRDDVRPDRIVFVSSTSVYGSATGTVDETTPPQPDTYSGQIMLEAENLLRDATHGTPTAAVCLRLGGIYGPGRSQLLDRVRRGQATIPASPRFTNRIHRDDAAAAIVHLATMTATPEAVYLGVDDAPAEYGDVVRFLAEQMDAPTPPVSADATGGKDRRCSNARLRDSGFTFAFPTYVEGYRAVLAGQGFRHP